MASYKTLLLPLLHEILVREVGEANIKPLEWSEVSPVKYSFSANINGEDEEVIVDFEHITDEAQKQYYLPQKYRSLKSVYNIAYMVSGTEIQSAKTTLKVLLTVMSTVVDIVRSFVQANSPEALYVTASAKELGSSDKSQKANLYRAFIEKQLSSVPGYGVDTYRDGFIIVKQSK